jgi:hypothetical protein
MGTGGFDWVVLLPIQPNKRNCIAIATVLQ